MIDRNKEKNMEMKELKGMQTRIFFGSLCGFCLFVYIFYLFIPFV
jgi:hypothetical protein